MEKNIKEIANKYRSENGNERITQKDLLFYIIARLDDLEKQDSNQDKKIEKNRICIQIFWIILPICVAIAGLIGSLI